MLRFVSRRLAALALCLCLLPGAVLAEDEVTRSDFTLSLTLDAQGFPQDGAAHYADWEAFLDKLSLRGVVDSQRYPQTYDRVYFTGGLYIGDECYLPFEYDQYYSFRYLRSPALRGNSVFFQMHNFFEFMLKGYYFMNLPTQLLALPLYPEAAYELFHLYLGPLEETLGGDESRVIPYETLSGLAAQLTSLIYDDYYAYDKAYFFLTCLLTHLGASDEAVDRMLMVEDWLAFLDPDQEGMTLANDGSRITYTIGGRELCSRSLDGSALSLRLPDELGRELAVDYENAGGVWRVAVRITQEEEERLAVSLTVDGLPVDGALSAQGNAVWTASGTALEEAGQAGTQTFTYRYERDAAQTPYAMRLEADWLHPQTGEAALRVTCEADVETLPPDAMIDRPYDNQDDLFSLNEWKLEELKQRFTPSLALSAVPFVLQMPLGALSDALGFLYSNGFLAFLGLE